MPSIYPINDNFPDGFRDALAQIVLEFGRVEYLLKLCLKDVKGEGFDEGMAAAEKPTRFDQLCENMLTAAKDQLTDDEYAGLQAYVDQAKVLASYRNDSMHAYWTMHDGKIMRFRPRWDGVQLLWDRSQSVTVDELVSEADKMRKLREWFDPVRLGWSVRQTDA